MPESVLEQYNIPKAIPNISNKIESLKKDIEFATSFRSGLAEKLNISLDQSQNGRLGNFTLGLIDGLMELPAVVELYMNNEAFREQFWITLRQLSIRDFVNSILEIGEEIVSGSPYLIGKGGLKAILLATGIGGLLKQFGCTLLKQGSKMSIGKVAVTAGLTATHAIGYATNSNINGISDAEAKQKISSFLR